MLGLVVSVTDGLTDGAVEEDGLTEGTAVTKLADGADDSFPAVGLTDKLAVGAMDGTITSVLPADVGLEEGEKLTSVSGAALALGSTVGESAIPCDGAAVACALGAEEG